MEGFPKETIDCSSPLLTVGWLLSEVTRRYNEKCSELNGSSGQHHKRKLIVGLKSVKTYPALDYYLTQLGNTLDPLERGTTLEVHFSKKKSKNSSDYLKTSISKEDFEYLKVIGRGGYSKVVLARKIDSGRLYAIKIMKKADVFSRTKRSMFISEVDIQNSLKECNFIVDLYYAFQTQDELYLAMDLCVGGTLFYFLNQLEPGIKNEQVAKFYLAEIILALEFIHAQNIIYRDLKPENVLIDIDGHIKIADFGLAKKLKHKDDFSTTFCGSPEYLAPEMLLGIKHSKKVDFYTLGCLTYELLIGIPPYYSEDRHEMSREILEGKLFFPSGVSEEAQDLMRWMLSKDARKRPSEVSEIKNHKFFEDIHWGKFMKKQVIPPWLPNLYNWHYNPRFMNIPLSDVFGDKFEKEDLHARGSFYIELNPDSMLEDKLSILDLDYSSIVGQEKSAGRIYESTDCKEYLEDFDFEQDPDEEIFIKEQIQGYKERYKEVLRLGKNQIKQSDSDENEENDIDDTEESHADCINANEVKKSLISERMHVFGLEKNSRVRSTVRSSIRTRKINLSDNRKLIENASFLTSQNNRAETLASTVSIENFGHGRSYQKLQKTASEMSMSPRKLQHTNSIIPKISEDPPKASTIKKEAPVKGKFIHQNNYKKYKKYLTKGNSKGNLRDEKNREIKKISVCKPNHNPRKKPKSALGGGEKMFRKPSYASQTTYLIKPPKKPHPKRRRSPLNSHHTVNSLKSPSNRPINDIGTITSQKRNLRLEF